MGEEAGEDPRKLDMLGNNAVRNLFELYGLEQSML